MNYKKTLLIGPRTIKNNSIINDDFDESVIMNAVKYVTDINLQHVTGSQLLWKLQELVSEKKIDAEGNELYKELLDDYVIPFLTYQTVAEIMPLAYAKIRNMGVVTNTDEHTQSLSLNDTMTLVEQYKVKAIHYLNVLKKYLCKNTNLFPELTNPCDCSIEQPHLDNKLPCPIYLS